MNDFFSLRRKSICGIEENLNASWQIFFDIMRKIVYIIDISCHLRLDMQVIRPEASGLIEGVNNDYRDRDYRRRNLALS